MQLYDMLSTKMSLTVGGGGVLPMFQVFTFCQGTPVLAVWAAFAV